MAPLLLGNVLLAGFLAGLDLVAPVRYTPDWDSLDSRPLPPWFDDAKLGIFIHWGVFSVPSFGGEAAFFWYYWKMGNPAILNFLRQNYRPGVTYADFAPMFTAEFYRPDDWADIFSASGARYVVLTSKHHEGFSNWASNVSFNWNAMDVGPRRDLVGDLANSIRKRTSIYFGLYHSLFEWFNPYYLKDKQNKFRTQEFVQSKTMPELYELVNTYKPDIIWSDGDWEADDTYWNSTEFIAWLYNDSPVKDNVVINDRWGKGTSCKHGGFWNCHDKYNPGKLQRKKWENALTIDLNSWGYRRTMKSADVISMDRLTDLLAETVSCGGNLLMNVGPTHDGRIDPLFEERLRQMGQWMRVNGEAIYSSRPWSYQNDTLNAGVWYTSKNSSSGRDVYAILLEWPGESSLSLGAPVPSDSTMITMLGYSALFKWTQRPGGGITILMPPIPHSQMPCRKLEFMAYYKAGQANQIWSLRQETFVKFNVWTVGLASIMVVTGIWYRIGLGPFVVSFAFVGIFYFSK